MNGLVWVGSYRAVDLQQWASVSPKFIRTVRAGVTGFVKVECPACGLQLCVPREDFTVHQDGSIASDKPLNCARSSAAHGYWGGCGHTFSVLKRRRNSKLQRTPKQKSSI